jgi:DNA-directed RNA polymerase II subunit RPB1
MANPNYYNEDVKSIESIDFSISRNKDIKLYSAVRDDPYGIDLAESYESYEPKKGGLVDLRLGTCDPYLPCTTCGLNSLECPGHFGHVVLAEAVFHFGFLNHLKSLLQCVCLKCSNLLVEKTEAQFKKSLLKKSEQRFKEIKSIAKNIAFCFQCGAPVPKIKREVKYSGSIKITVERDVLDTNIKSDDKKTFNKKIKDNLSPRDCYNILRNISDNDCFLLGFNPNIARPEDLIIENFPIPPVIIRPTAKIDLLASATMEDALTLKISDIIVNNKRVRQQLEKENIGNELSMYDQDISTLLQYHIATYFDNESVNLPRTEFKTGGRPTKSISERIKGKGGRVRSNLMGKRVDFSARSVVTSDPYIDIDQVGIPKKIAVELTIPEVVTPYNFKHLSKLVRNGRDIYPGANNVLKTTYRDGKAELQKIDLKYRKKTIKLNYGDIVERHSIDGDYVLFNRQPTLHKPSMMGHKIQVIDDDNLNTFRVNVSVCKPYNADFDGDEMNIFLAQSIQARNELKRIANVQYQIIGVKNSNPIIGCEQDSLSGAYMLTEPSVKLKGYEIANILCNTTSETKCNIQMDKIYSGHELFSHIIPKGINVTKYNKDKINFQIVNGNIKTGYLDKKSLSTEKNSIIHFIWDKFGPNKTRIFIDDVQRLILNYLLLRGQTISFADMLINDSVYEGIQQLSSNRILEAKYNLTQYENEYDSMDPIIFEGSMTSDLDTVQSTAGKMILESMSPDNFFNISVMSGAKGGANNIAQCMGIIGQTAVEGSIIRKRVENRALIYFHRDDDTPEARGYIKSSYLSGLQGFELFYNTMAGREGAIDTAIKTAQTGYIQRQLIKGLEDLSIQYDGTNRNARGIIIQQVYGENGVDQSTQTEIVMHIISMNNKSIEEKLCFNKKQLDALNKSHKSNFEKFNNNYKEKMIIMRDNLRRIQQKSLINYKFLTEKYMVPVNLLRITEDYSNNKECLELNPNDIIDMIEDFLNDHNYRILTFIKKSDKYMKQDDRDLKYLFEIALYTYLAPVKCIYEYGLTKKNFSKLMDDIKLCFTKALIVPGEMVGIIAAQSIGEPTSQMNLNTKHFAGSSSKGSANMGVGRIQELLRYSKNIKTPQMTIYFKDPYCSDRSALNRIVSYLKYLSIRELVSTAEIYYDLPNSNSMSKKLIADNVSGPFFVNNMKADILSLPFVFRFKMNIEKMISKETTLLDIKTKFISYWYKNFTNFKTMKKNDKNIFSRISRCCILSNSMSDDEQIIHIRFSMSSFNYNYIIDFLNIIFDDITLKGLDNISNESVEEEMKVTFNNTTGDIISGKEYVVYTSGINFEKLRMIKGIDLTRTKCNDVATTLKLYGIEATRQLLINELSTVYESNSSSINHNHLSVLIDQMCHTGEIISIDRHGMGKIDSDPIARASFEKTMDHFINAAIFNEKDTMRSVSSRIAGGRVIQGGTGSFDIMLDTNKLINSEYTDNETGGRVTFTPLDEDSVLQDVLKYGISNINFFIPK